ncbi:hypothetical protein [Halosimplex amylolyticum]|uniref:hypothetical protein n=1 Tax=Halosimplex amylolyticum TaxID=3396616 RepID=UPI003F55AB96
MALHTRRYATAALLLLSLAGLSAVAAVDGQSLAERGDGSGGNVTVLASQGVVADDLADDEAVREFRADGTLDAVGERKPVVTGDTVVLRIRSEQVNDTFAVTGGSNTTDRFYRMLDGPETNVSVRALVGPNRQPYDVALERSETHVVRDGANATLSVVVDTRDLVLVERDTRDPISFEPSVDQFVVEVETRDDSQTDAFDDEFTVAFPDATVDSITTDLRFAGSGPARAYANTTTLGLSGQTNLLPETSVTVEAVGPNGTILATDTITTTENRSERAPRDEVQSEFAAALRGVASDEYEWFTLRATGQNRTVWQRDVVVGPEPRWSNLSATALGTDGDDWTLRVDASLRLPDQGILEVELRTEDGLVTREVAVPEGRSHQTVHLRNVSSLPDGPIELEAHWDRRGDGRLVFQEDPTFATGANVTRGMYDELYTRLQIDGTDGLRDARTTTTSPSTATAPVATTAPPTTTTPGTVTLSPSPHPPTTPTATDANSPTDSAVVTGTTADGGPGFGLGIALLAVGFAVIPTVRQS